MANFTTTVLRHSCRWTTPEDEPKNINGFPDTATLDVNEGFEVLYFINRYMEYKGWFSPITFQNIESHIKTRLPFNVRTHKAVREWLDVSFKR
jgi:hypothetical protein